MWQVRVPTQYYPHPSCKNLAPQIWPPNVPQGAILPHFVSIRGRVPGQGPPLAAHSAAPTTSYMSECTIAGSACLPLSLDERATSTTLLQQVTTLSAIGTALGRPKATIAYSAREIREAAKGARVD